MPPKPGELDPVLVSACLLGVGCRFDAGHKHCPGLRRRLEGVCVIPVCPEQLGGLPTPRPRSEFQGGVGLDVLAGRTRIVNAEGCDVTDHFLRGARETLRLARTLGAAAAYLKARSPSCGVGEVYDRGQLVAGNGVTAQLLQQHGIRVVPVE